MNVVLGTPTNHSFWVLGFLHVTSFCHSFQGSVHHPHLQLVSFFCAHPPPPICLLSIAERLTLSALMFSPGGLSFVGRAVVAGCLEGAAKRLCSRHNPIFWGHTSCPRLRMHAVRQHLPRGPGHAIAYWVSHAIIWSLFKVIDCQTTCTKNQNFSRFFGYCFM